MHEIQIWSQMFFEDGSVSEGKRIPAEWLEERNAYCINGVANSFLDSTNRQEGWLLLWGAGNMVFKHYPTSFSSESDSSAL